MTPKTTTSPPPTSYGPYDDLNDFDTSGPSEANLSPYNNRQVDSPASHDRAPTTTTAARSNSHRSATTSFAALLLPRRAISSSTIQAIILAMVYSFCITTLCCIFCASYILTFYDDTKRIVGTSRVWARVKNGVRERLSMMGEDWEEFAKKYFDAAGLDHATNNNTTGKNGHLGGNQQTNNHNSKSAEWEEWMKGMMFGFVSFVAGQDVMNRFQHSTSFKFQRPPTNAAASDGARK